MTAEHQQARRHVIDLARWLRTEAAATRERARQALAEDRARRLRTGAPGRRAEPPRGVAGAGVLSSRLGRRGAAGGERAGSGAGAPERSTATSVHGDITRSSAPRPFRVHSEAITPSRLVLRVVGEIDLATVPVLAEALQFRVGAAETGTELIVDMAAVTFIDARGLATLVEAAEAARSCGVVFRTTGRPACLLRLLAIAGTGDALDTG